MMNLCIVPHTLSPAQKIARVESALHLKKILVSAKPRGWGYILTRDESWLHFTINHDHIWLPEEALNPTRPRQTINTPKRMLTIFWSPVGFPLVQLLPKGQHFNAGYFCANILQEIDQNRPAATAEHQRRNIVRHFDNARPRTAGETLGFLKSHRMKRAPHPAFSPGLAPSDFYLFGKIKTALIGSEFESEQTLLDGVLGVISTISREELEAVFEDWLSRLDQCVQRDWDYVV
jgi:histone-lysine N-methyltransferase SETMAR